MAKKILACCLLLAFTLTILLPSDVDARGRRGKARVAAKRGRHGGGRQVRQASSRRSRGNRVARGRQRGRGHTTVEARGRRYSRYTYVRTRHGKRRVYQTARYTPPRVITNRDITNTRLQAPPYSSSRMPASAIPPERVREIQDALQREGYLQGEPSGQYDRSTIEAMTRYQQDNNFRTTGYPTAESLQKLKLTRKRRVTGTGATPNENPANSNNPDSSGSSEPTDNR